MNRLLSILTVVVLIVSCSIEDLEVATLGRLEDQSFTIKQNETKEIILGDLADENGAPYVYTVIPEDNVTFTAANTISYSSAVVGVESLSVSANTCPKNVVCVKTSITATITITVTEDGGTDPNPTPSSLIEGYDFYNPYDDPNLPTGLAKGESYTNPHYGTTVTRFTDAVADGASPARFLVNEYSRKQAFNVNSTRVLIFAENGYWNVFNSDGTHLRRLSGPASDCMIDWHPTDPDLITYAGHEGRGLKFYQQNVTDGTETTIADLTALTSINGLPGKTSILDIWPTAFRAWTKGEGTSSRNGRYRGLQIETEGYSFLGLIVYDHQENAIVGYLDAADYGGGRPDHVSMSPSGQYVVPSSVTPEYGGNGTRAYKRDFSEFIQLHNGTEHSDLGVLPNGNDVYVANNYQDAEGHIFMYELYKDSFGGTKTELTHLHQYPHGNPESIESAVHFSLKAFDKPGWMLMSTYSTKPYTGEGAMASWAQNKILAVELVPNGKILNISNTYGDHSLFPGENEKQYWAEPKASVNSDFTKVIFTSSWFKGANEFCNAYTIDLTADQIQ